MPTNLQNTVGIQILLLSNIINITVLFLPVTATYAYFVPANTQANKENTSPIKSDGKKQVEEPRSSATCKEEEHTAVKTRASDAESLDSQGLNTEGFHVPEPPVFDGRALDDSSHSTDTSVLERGIARIVAVPRGGKKSCEPDHMPVREETSGGSDEEKVSEDVKDFESDADQQQSEEEEDVSEGGEESDAYQPQSEEEEDVSEDGDAYQQQSEEKEDVSEGGNESDAYQQQSEEEKDVSEGGEQSEEDVSDASVEDLKQQSEEHDSDSSFQLQSEDDKEDSEASKLHCSEGEDEEEIFEDGVQQDSENQESIQQSEGKASKVQQQLEDGISEAGVQPAHPTSLPSTLPKATDFALPTPIAVEEPPVSISSEKPPEMPGAAASKSSPPKAEAARKSPPPKAEPTFKVGYQSRKVLQQIHDNEVCRHNI